MWSLGALNGATLNARSFAEGGFLQTTSMDDVISTHQQGTIESWKSVAPAPQKMRSAEQASYSTFVSVSPQKARATTMQKAALKQRQTLTARQRSAFQHNVSLRQRVTLRPQAYIQTNNALHLSYHYLHQAPAKRCLKPISSNPDIIIGHKTRYP